MKLYYCETLNPRKACAVAQFLELPIEYVRVDLAAGEHKRPDFLALNPNGKLPVLQDGDRTLWEANAIMCRLSDVAKADLWPKDERQIEVLRWLSWDSQHFTRNAGTLYFEHIIKPAIGMGEASAAAVGQATREFEVHARILDDHLSDRTYLVGGRLSVADFAVGVTLPWAAAAKIPLAAFPAIKRWHDRLNEMAAWRRPFPVRALAAT